MQNSTITALLALSLCTMPGCTKKSDGVVNGGSTTPAPMGCTEIGCQDGLLVRVTPGSAWPAGAYRFVIEADGETTTCSGSLPLPACETRALTCEGPQVQITESGCALEPTQHAFGDIMFASNPTSVTVTVERDGQALGSQTWSPAYESVQPNGPGCEPTCTNATVELALSF